MLYYYPRYRRNIAFKEWLYGVGEYRRAQEIPGLNWLVVRGESDMIPLFRIADVLFNPKPLPSISRLADECALNGIPVVKSVKELKEWMNDRTVC